MGSVEITPVNGDSSFVDPTTSALEQARAMERHFNAMDMELKKAGLAQSLKVSPVNIASSQGLLSPTTGRATSPLHVAASPSASSVTPPASATSPPPQKLEGRGSKLEAIFGGKRKVYYN